MSPNPKGTADFVTFIEEVLNGKPIFFVQCDLYLLDGHIRFQAIENVASLTLKF